MLKAMVSALALACWACSASAAVYTGASFTQRSDGKIELQGFGRTSETFNFPTLAPGVTTFFDTWNIGTDDVTAGEYSFTDMVISATGRLRFDSITFNSIDAQGVRHTVVFDLTDPRQAVGSGSFTVLESCPIASCVWIDVAGRQRGSTSVGYGGTTVAAPVPEPGTYGLMALGLAAVGVAARRRRA